MVLNVQEWGDPGAPPLICLHGLSGYGRRFHRLAGLLAGRRLIAPDLRGHGASGREPPWDVDTHVGDVVETVESLGVERCDWLGFSFGGLLVATVAAGQPDRLQRAVLLDPAMALPPADALERAERDRLEVSFGSAEDVIEAELASGSLFSTPREFLEEEVRENIVTRADGRLEYRWLPSMAVTAWSEMTLPAPLVAAVPTLLVTGERSWIKVDVDRYRAALGDNLTVIAVPGGHSVLWDSFDETAAAVSAFLGAQVAGSAGRTAAG